MTGPMPERSVNPQPELARSWNRLPGKRIARLVAGGVGPTRMTLRRLGVIAAGGAIAVSAAATLAVPASTADPYQPPPSGDVIFPLPVVTPTPSNWSPKFPFPYDQTKGSVTEADVNAEREMCQWFSAQFDTLRRQIDRLQFDRITPNGPGVISGAGSDWDYSQGDLQRQVDIVTTNIDQSVEFLAPRVQALSRGFDYVGDDYFPLYQAKSFYLLWQNLSNVNDGIKAHQPDWFTGPSVLIFKKWGTRINRSHVCD